MHSEAVAHGVNIMITVLYFCFRADMVCGNTTEAWYRAIEQFLMFDGGLENTGQAMQAFLTHLVTVGWKKTIETYRNLTK